MICGELEGRQSDDQVTVFDSTGIALQDSATVPLEYERALAAGVGRREEDDLDVAERARHIDVCPPPGGVELAFQT